MPRPRKKTDRWQQVLNYWVQRFPPPFPVRLVFAKPEDDAFAESYEEDRPGARVIFIIVDPSRTWRDGLHDLAHEYGHVLTWPVSHRQLEACDEHPPEFWAAYGRVYVDFFDEDGHRDSQDFPW